MSIDISLSGTTYPVPSSAADTNWAAKQVAWEQAVSAAANNAVRRLDVDTAAVGNVTTGEDNLITYAMPAATLVTDAQAVRITAWGTGANNANAKTLKMYFGATAVLTFSLTANQVDTWRIEAIVARTGAATQDANATLLQAGTASAIDIENTTPTETLSGAITIKCTGEATSTNDIVQEGMSVELLP